MDVQYSPTSALKANVTVNPDFAQVEADQLEINLTRFPTRFPEKRPFFVEGNSFFETPYDLMFSRRIGSRGNILWGGKLTGKVGNYSVGVLGNQTGEFNFSEDASEGHNLTGYATKEKAWFSSIRIKRDILKRSNVGILFVNKEQPRGDNWTHSRVGGIDMNLALGKTYHLTGQYAGSFHPGEDKDNVAYTVDFAQRNYLWSSSIGFERVAPHFEINQTGFLRKETEPWLAARLYACLLIPHSGAVVSFSLVSPPVSHKVFIRQNILVDGENGTQNYPSRLNLMRTCSGGALVLTSE